MRVLRLNLGDRVLDPGCGTGTYLSTLREEVGPQDVPATVANIHPALRPGGRLFAPDLRLVPGGLGAPFIWTFGVIYRSLARWTGVDVLDTVRATFGDAEVVNPEGRPLAALPAFAPVVMITAVRG